MKIYKTKQYTATRDLKEEAIQLAGLKKYLQEYTLIKEREAIEVHLFEEYLIYAQMMGIAKEVAKAVANGEFDRGILVCGTGLGMSITANKIKGIRAVSIENTYSARVSRAHNNSNVLCLGERVIGDYLALDIVDIWLKTGFEGGRHKKRIDMIE